jgi:hypothetical protein
MMTNKHTKENSSPLKHDLTEYVGIQASKAIKQNLENMNPDEILAFKQSMEAILKVLSKDIVYH